MIFLKFFFPSKNLKLLQQGMGRGLWKGGVGVGQNASNSNKIQNETVVCSSVRKSYYFV